jgi:hypothetical protein
MVINRASARRPRRLIFRRPRRVIHRLVRRRYEPVLPLPSDRVPTNCFGELSEGDQLALEGFVARNRPSPQRPAGEPPSYDSAEWLG